MKARHLPVSLLAAGATTAVLAAVSVPLASSRGLEEPSVSALWRIGGFVLALCAIVVVVLGPLLMGLARIEHVRLSRPAAALTGAFVVYLVLMIIPTIETGSVSPFFWNMQGWVKRPLEFLSDWLPFLGGGAAFAATAWKPPPRNSPD